MSKFLVSTALATALALSASCASAQPAAKSNPLNAIGAWAQADVAAAMTASLATPQLQDQVGNACLAEIQTFASLIQAHPLPATFRLATDIEYARLDQAELNLICRNTACAQVWQDMANAAQALAIGMLPFSFTSICAKVPVVGLTISTPASVASEGVPPPLTAPAGN